jgi:hypothetical protein
VSDRLFSLKDSIGAIKWLYQTKQTGEHLQNLWARSLSVARHLPPLLPIRGSTTSMMPLPGHWPGFRRRKYEQLADQ